MLLYIHIPFCDSKCNYCAFNSYVGLYHLKENYMVALVKQLNFELEKIDINPFKSVFIGGGTPSCIDAELYQSLFSSLAKYIDSDTEITIEANPNSATISWQQDMFDLGVNRISFGVQTFDDEKLKFLNRSHSKLQAIDAINNAKKVGFERINCDIIYDTSLDTKALIDSDLNIIKTLPIDHISAYSLTLEEGTKFYQKSDVRIENEDMAKYIFSRFQEFGFTQYEISNFAKSEQSRSKHNFGYWEYESYLGVGAGAVGAYNQKRFYNQKDIEKYIQNPLEFEEIESLSNEDVLVEKTLLGLRSAVGCDMKNYNDTQKQKIEILENENKIFKKENIFYSNDFMLADELALFIVDDI